MKILHRKVLTDHSGVRIVSLDILSADIAKRAKPGQFVALMVCAEGEKIPLTIVDTDIERGSITLIFQVAGFTTSLLDRLNVGDCLYALTGPLGHATEIKNYGKVILIGGGVGIAEIYPVAKALKAAGNNIITILGSRTKELLILEKELKSLSDEFCVTTDDGSYGEKGFVTDVLNRILSGKQVNRQSGKLIYAVGPIPMMKNVAAASRPYGIKTLVSLNALMVDATGMCGCCRVSVSGKVRFSCVDGPEFDAHEVDWDELSKRNAIYADKEKHICRLKR